MRIFRRVFYLFPMLLALVLGCGRGKDAKRGADTRLTVAVGIAPTAFLAERIGGDRVKIVVLLPEGRTPHDFSPSPTTMRQAGAAKLVLVSGLPFENRLNFSGAGRYRDISVGVKKIPLIGGHHHHHNHAEADNDHDHDHDHDSLDPHIWLSFNNLRVMAKNICAAFCELDPDGANEYKNNSLALDEELQAKQRQVAEMLSPFVGKKLFVFHSALGYFANEFNLEQVAVDDGGREPNPAKIRQWLNVVSNDNMRLLVAQKDFNPDAVSALVRRVGGQCEIFQFNALTANVSDELLSLATKYAATQIVEKSGK